MTLTGLPASFAQERLWFLDQLEPGTAAYNLVRAFRISGPLNVNALTSAIRAVIQRHESLRTIFTSVDGGARQIVLADVDVQVPIINLTGHLTGDRKREALRIASDEGKKPFDLTRGPLFRTFLVHLDRDEYLMVLVLHHIITDGWSISILFRELAKLLRGFCNWQEDRTSGAARPICGIRRVAAQIYFGRRARKASQILESQTNGCAHYS